MKPPPGYPFPSYASLSTSLVCKLSKSLYGLKQASQNWYAKLSSTLLHEGFTQSYSDSTFFVKTSNSIFLAVLIYVDDILI